MERYAAGRRQPWLPVGCCEPAPGYGSGQWRNCSNQALTGGQRLLHSSGPTAIINVVSGGPSGVEPPVPISNTEVKHPSADDTALATGWENRSPPGALVAIAPAGAPSIVTDWPAGSSLQITMLLYTHMPDRMAPRPRPVISAGALGLEQLPWPLYTPEVSTYNPR